MSPGGSQASAGAPRGFSPCNTGIGDGMQGSDPYLVATWAAPLVALVFVNDDGHLGLRQLADEPRVVFLLDDVRIVLVDVDLTTQAIVSLCTLCGWVDEWQVEKDVQEGKRNVHGKASGVMGCSCTQTPVVPDWLHCVPERWVELWSAGYVAARPHLTHSGGA